MSTKLGAGQICYGIIFQREVQFPWDKAGYSNIENW